MCTKNDQRQEKTVRASSKCKLTEISDDAVEARSGVSESLLPRTESAEVFSGLGDNVGTQFHDDTAGILATDGDIEVNFRVPATLLAMRRRMM